MTVAIIAVSLVVLGFAAFAAMGRLGGMPADPVTDDYPGRVPSGPVDAEFLAQVKFPIRRNGYDPAAVDAYLERALDGSDVAPEDVRFTVRRSGYDMTIVDEVLDRIAAQQRAEGASAGRSVDLDSVYRPAAGDEGDD